MTEAGAHICMGRRENLGESCNDYCSMEQLRELPPLGFIEGYPPRECCGELMHLRRPLIAIPT